MSTSSPTGKNLAPTTWVYFDGAVIQGVKMGPQFTLPVDDVQDQTLVLYDDRRRAVEFQLQESTSPAVVTDSKGDQYQGYLMGDGNTDTVALKVINKDSGNASLVTFRNYQQITQDLSYNRVQVRTEHRDPISYSYQTSDIYWKCTGEAQVYDGNKIVIQSYAAIQSSPDKQYHTRVKIVTGSLRKMIEDKSPHRYDGRRSSVSMMAMGVSPISSEKESSTNEDLIVHDQGVKVLSGLNKFLLAESAILDGAKVYFHRTSDSGTTYVGYRMTAKDIIPACQLTVNQVYPDGSKALGVINITEHRPGEMLDLKLSPSMAVKVETIVVTIEDKPARDEIAQSLGIIPTKVWHTITEMIDIKITNNTTVRQTVILGHFLGERILLETSMKHGQFRYSDQTLEIPVVVEPPANVGDSMILAITITTAQLNNKV